MQIAFVGKKRIAACTNQQLGELKVHHVGKINVDWSGSTTNVISVAGTGDLPGMRDDWKMLWTERSKEVQPVTQP